MPKRKTRDTETVTISGIEYAKQQICDDTIDLIKIPDGITFPSTPKNDSSYTPNCSTLYTTEIYSTSAGTTSVICTIPDGRILRLTVNDKDFEEELNGLIIQYYLSHQKGCVGICKVYEFGFLLDNDNKQKYLYAILENVPIPFNRKVESIKPMIKQLLGAINFLHSHNISHLDIKPQNIGFTINGRLKIFDFGFSQVNRSVSWKDQVCNYFRSGHKGSKRYVDPYYFSYCTSSNKSDVFSAGVIIFDMFFKPVGIDHGWDNFTELPYWDSTICGPLGLKCIKWNEFVVRPDMIKHPDINTPAKIDSLKTLLREMLEPNPFYRMTAEKALSHPWLNQHNGGGKHNLTSKRRRTGTRNKRRK